MTAWEKAIDGFVDSIAEEMRSMRRHLHRNPELSLQEFQTTEFLADKLRQLGISFRIPPSKRGVIAEGNPDSSMPRVAMRGDIDALPITDQKDVPYRSQCDGVMHACGHDAHTTMVLAAARALKDVEGTLPWPCPWRAIFQPAEEVGLGAQEMIQAGAVDGVRAIVAFHVAPDLPLGKVGWKEGEMTAGCQDIDVVINGKGGHAARPHLSIDPIAAAVHFLGDVYRLIPRLVDSRDPVVVTFGSIKGGEKNNVIPDRVFLKGTIRTLSRKSAEEVRAFLEKIRRGVEEITGATIGFTFDDYLGPVFNNAHVVQTMEKAAAEVIGPENLVHLPKASMGAEDFGNYGLQVPGCMLRLGVGIEGQPLHHLHTPSFDLDERALAIGAKILARTLVLLAKPEEK